MNRLLANRGILLGAIVVCATGLVGAAGLLSRPDTPAAPPVAAPPAAPAATVTKQQPAQDPRCANQDQDDDAKESKAKPNKPDLDDDELECGDQNDDDREVGEGKEREHGEHDQKAPANKASAGKTAKAPAAGK